MSIVYISSLQAGKDCLNLIKHSIAIDHIVTIDARTAARASVSGYADFSDAGIAVHHLRRYSMTDPQDLVMIESLAPRLIIVNGWNRLIPKPILELGKGCVGFHGSWKPLPFGRGRSPITWALLRGETEFFLHLLQLDDGVDSGDIIDTVRFEIELHDSSATLLQKVGVASARLLLRNVVAILDGTATRTPQTGEPTYLPKLTPAVGLIDWNAPMQQVRNLVRAKTRPYRGAYCDIDYRGNRVRMVIWDALPYPGGTTDQPRTGAIAGEIDGQPLIRCADGLMLIKEFTLEPAPPGPA